MKLQLLVLSLGFSAFACSGDGSKGLDLLRAAPEGELTFVGVLKQFKGYLVSGSRYPADIQAHIEVYYSLKTDKTSGAEILQKSLKTLREIIEKHNEKFAKS